MRSSGKVNIGFGSGDARLKPVLTSYPRSKVQVYSHRI